MDQHGHHRAERPLLARARLRLFGACPAVAPILAAATLSSVGGCGGADPPVVCDQPAVARHAARPDQCGPTADYTPINSYDGDLVAVHEREDAVALLGGGCTGTLIAAAAGPVVLTAGHCVRLGDRPVVSFNFEDAPDGQELITDGTVIEQATAPDYALVELDVQPAVAPTPLAIAPGEVLAIIQHPRGRPKVVAEGAFLDACDDLLYYVDLDTEVGSSGAGVLAETGSLVGIHTDGDCEAGGTNYGWTAASIVAASAHLQDVDLAP